MKKVAIVARRNQGRKGNYFAAVEKCGAQAVELYYEEGPELVKAVDAVLLPGGADVDPALYGEENRACMGLDKALDELEMAVIRAAVEQKKPLFGVCRGMQLINVYFGGTLIQNVPHTDIHRWCESGADRAHLSRAEPGCFLCQLYHERDIPINSAHHQAVKKLGEGLEAVQYSADGLIEAFRHKSLPVWGVQWHPERMCLACRRKDTVDGLPMFRFLVEHAGAHV